MSLCSEVSPACCGSCCCRSCRDWRQHQPGQHWQLKHFYCNFRIFYFIFCIQYSYSSYTVLDFLLPRSEPGDCPDGVGIFRPPQLGWRDWAGLCLQYPGVLQAGLCWHSPPRLQHQQFLDEIFPFRAARTKWGAGHTAETGIYLMTSNWSSSKV